MLTQTKAYASPIICAFTVICDDSAAKSLHPKLNGLLRASALPHRLADAGCLCSSLFVDVIIQGLQRFLQLLDGCFLEPHKRFPSVSKEPFTSQSPAMADHRVLKGLSLASPPEVPGLRLAPMRAGRTPCR
jgi:hypothetical protein